MRIKMTDREFEEILEAKAWCERKGGNGFGGFYDDLLEFHHRRRTLPDSAYQGGPEEEGGGDQW